MRKYLTSWVLISLGFFFSCATPPRNSVVETPVPPELSLLPETKSLPETEPLPETGPAAPGAIMGKGLNDPEKLAAFLLNSNPNADPRFTAELARLYTEEAAVEGVNHDIAFAQMCLETGFLRYGGLVTPDMNNFCGLGSIGPGQNGERFSSPRIGVRAHIQHLKAYATGEELKGELVDPRYRWVRYGSAPDITGLAGTWAADKEYAVKIRTILDRLYSYPDPIKEKG
jgi:hypothetical protein